MAAAILNMSPAPATRRRVFISEGCIAKGLPAVTASSLFVSIWRAILKPDPERQSGREGAMRRGFWAHCACVLVTAAGLLAGALTAHAAGDDANICVKESGDAAIDACSRAIQSRRYSGHVLARQYLSRGVERRAKQDYDVALTDFAEALKVDKKYADAFYNRCAIYNFKKEYDSAITECSQAIKLGPSADATMAGGSERLGKDHALSDYYTERGFAYFQKDDAIHLNPNNGRALKTRGLAYEAKGDSRATADLASAKLLGE